ncbi:MAG: imidazole glycerol phosphate synthase subunit HisH [Flavobacteriaceae bacterium]
MDIVIIDYGAGNIKSIDFAFKRLGIETKLSNNIEDITKADKVIFPGVGEASSAMRMLYENNLDKLIPQLEQPVLGICLGMQLLCNYSEEGDTKGLGVFDVDIKRFNSDLKVPQMGWNTIYDLKSMLFNKIGNDEYMYLVHSYYAELCDNTISKTNYGFEYSTALKNNNFYGVQFHPEKSGIFGEQILDNFLKIDRL